MKNVKRLLATFFVFIFLTGLSSTFDIVVDVINPGCPCFKLQKRGLFWRVEKQVELNSFSVVEKVQGKWDYKNPLWEFTLKPGDALVVSQFEYGKTPVGFLETTKAKALVAGVQYQAFGAGPGARGSSDFVIKKDRDQGGP